MKKRYRKIILLSVLFGSVVAADQKVEKDKKVVGAQKGDGQLSIDKSGIKSKPEKESKKQKKKNKISPVFLAQNLKKAIDFLSKNEAYMNDVEPLYLKNRALAVNISKAEACFTIQLAASCFTALEGKENEFVNWVPNNFFMNEDVYVQGVKKLSELNLKYNNDPYYKASQGQISRNRLKESIDESFLSIINEINRIIGVLSANEFTYSGHPYEPIDLVGHIALYESLANRHVVPLSYLNAYYHQWQVFFYRNLSLLLKLIAQMSILKATNEDDRNTLIEIAKRVPGDDHIVFPPLD